MKAKGASPVTRSETFFKKRRRGSIIAFEMVRLDRASREPLHQQLYRQIRDELKAGRFEKNSSRLPSSRELAADLGVSRLTVRVAFSQLHAEGYLASKKRSGTFVAESLPESFLSAPEVKKRSLRIGRPPRISERVTAIADERSGDQLNIGVGGPPGMTLLPGIPAVDEFPLDVWERLRAQVLARKGAHLLRYASSHGDADLRKAIAAYVCDSRGARCHPDQIVVVAGMQQAMLVSAMVLLNRGEPAWIEDPGFRQARRVFNFSEAKIIPRPIDAEGITITQPPRGPAPKIIFVTPSHQFPLGVTMSYNRRKALIDFANKHDAFIFEDDYNAEFRFTGPPLTCLQGLDDSGRVIYAGTMSKILYPSLRLGYLLVPEPLVDSMIKARAVMDQHSSAIDQATLARFLTEGFFLSHIKRMRKIYAERRLFFIEQFNRLLDHYFQLEVPEAGLHFVAWLRREADLTRIRKAAMEVGIRPPLLSGCCIKAELPPAFLFGFAAWSPAQVREGLTRLAAELKRGENRKKRSDPPRD